MLKTIWLVILMWSLGAQATTLEEAKAKTAHIESLNEAKQFMKFNPQQVYREALSSKELLYAKSKTCSRRNKTPETTLLHLNDRGDTVREGVKLKYYPSGQKQSAISKHQKIRYEYNQNGTLKFEKIRTKLEPHHDEQIETEYDYQGLLLVGYEQLVDDFKRGKSVKRTYEVDYDWDFGEYCSISRDDAGQITRRVCSDNETGGVVSSFIKGESSTKETKTLNRFGDYTHSKRVYIFNDGVESVAEETCSYNYEQKYFQFVGE